MILSDSLVPFLVFILFSLAPSHYESQEFYVQSNYPFLEALLEFCLQMKRLCFVLMN